MNVMQNEALLLQLNELTLTSHRVRYETSGMGQNEIKSIMLDELASCEMTQTSSVALLVLAVIALIGGLIVALGAAANESILNDMPALVVAPIIVAIFVAGLFIVGYFATQRQVLSLASAGITIAVSTQGTKRHIIEEFIDRAEAAMNARYLMTAGRT